jgi:DNA sulfur modification protein DndC
VPESEIAVKNNLTQKASLNLADKVRAEIVQAYFSNNYPWILGYSGGKDSTATLQLLWESLSSIPFDKRTKPIYVISSDTLVENPVIKKYLEKNLENININAQNQNLPISAEKLTPILNETFWVNLIGRGYPAPWQQFRWCTNRLKIATSTRYIQSTISKYGEVVVVLGTRKKESAARAANMKKQENKDKSEFFSKNSQFSAAFTYSPIRDWETWDVWRYLLQNKSPWGGDNNKLAQMYRDAEGECPFVVDEKTPTCGGSRFGCWVCTLVELDKSLTSLIESGEKWLKPLLDYRDFLYSTNDPEIKKEVRDYKLRRGVTLFKDANKSNEIIRGPYLLEFRKTLLEKLLETQQKVREVGPDPSISLISQAELHKIRTIWRSEGDWEDSVPLIYNRFYNDISWVMDDANLFNVYDKAELNKICRKYDLPEKLVVRLIDVELKTRGMSFRSSIFKEIDKVFNEEWREVEAIIDEQKKKILVN